ncbi:radical SAM family heme chaperone HemW [Cytobacillus purgationiresistens]|uniref:Heme chaperone HemW n=1 Tax=Cytobacillus purgationiresistens TaxID=863449 RepID=A0ABU0AFF5_9BACI|nr:radical SAM family heme chaperone HemW [Cytobacillus purgationiresistens]MDQ0269512.1 oxygen-independent coproporphyrinogen-3 oxidase [Cytobacillus purgationiresistens]
MINAAYIHIPFCEHICHYCDFNKVFLKGQPVDEYLDYLDKEIELTLVDAPYTKFKTIFIGGGTPTALNVQQLEKLLSTINKYMPFAEDVEYTFEANPGDLSAEKLSLLRAGGVNRISFGVQTFNDELLKRIGRVHRAKDVFQSIEAAKNAGFENISIDLIYSLPGQTLADFKETLATSFTLDIQHYSGYSLIIEPKTVFYNLMRKGKLPTPGEDAEAAMYETLMDEMEKQGFEQYEISNFAKPGFESKHNLTYWDNEWYYGFGAGAHGYVNGYRRSNYGPLKKYMDPLKEGKLPIIEEQKPTKAEQMEEEMFLGLRKIKGVSISRFEEKFSANPMQYFGEEIQTHIEKQLLQLDGDAIKLTRKGYLLGNEVFQSFIK